MRRNAAVMVGVVLAAVCAAAQQVGPKSGSLVIVGGAMSDPAIITRFIDLAGGADAPIVIVPTAGDADAYDAYWSGLRQFRDNGARNLTVLHTRDPKVADSEAFVRPLTTARGVFFTGGRQWRLADAYLDTRAHRELQALLDRGGVIGGSSAGATILGSFLVRGDTKGNELMVGDHVAGFGFLKNSAIDQHLLRRNRQFDLIDVIANGPSYLGLASTKTRRSSSRAIDSRCSDVAMSRSTTRSMRRDLQRSSIFSARAIGMTLRREKPPDALKISAAEKRRPASSATGSVGSQNRSGR